METYQISDAGVVRLAAPQDSILVIGAACGKPGSAMERFRTEFSECLSEGGRIGGLMADKLGVRYEERPCAHLRPSRVVWLDYANPALLRAILAAGADTARDTLGPGCAKIPPLPDDAETDALFSRSPAEIISALAERAKDERAERELSVFFENGTGQERNIFRDAAKAINVILPRGDREPEMAARRVFDDLRRAAREI